VTVRTVRAPDGSRRRPPAGRTRFARTAGARDQDPLVDHAGWTEDWLTVDGARIFYRRGPVTSGVPIVHIHGFAISGTYLLPTARRLAGRGTAVVPDLPGYGRSERSGRALAIPALARSLEAILDGLGLAKVVLIGNSMGCVIALQVAHDAPDRVHRLVLVSPAGGRQNQPLGRAIGQLAVDAIRESPRMARVAVPDYLHFGPVNAFNLFAQLTRFPSLERLETTPVPTLAVLGDRDPLMPSPRRVREIRLQSPDHVAVALIEGAAHSINFSHPGELASVVSAWLDGRDIIDDPSEPGHARSLPLHRDVTPEPGPDA
jgi:pimeloyl-ACP methyl ester carboxylesterase